MQIDISNGLTGEVLTTVDVDDTPSAWEVMVEVAKQQRLRTPYQVIVNPGGRWKRLSPLSCVAVCMNNNRPEVHIFSQPLRIPTERQYRQLLEAGPVSERYAGKAAELLGRGLDLSVPFLSGGNVSTLLAVAMLKDYDPEDYAIARPGDAIKHPSKQAFLTYLILQAKVHPDILPPKQQPTTMIGLAVALKNHALKLLVEAEATVHPILTKLRSGIPGTRGRGGNVLKILTSLRPESPGTGEEVAGYNGIR